MRFHGLGLPVVMLIVACSSPQRTAETQLAAAQRAMTALPAEARDIVPDEVTAIDDAIKQGDQAIQSGDYASASAGLAVIPDQLKQLADSLPARRAALQAEMDTLTIVVPRNLDAINQELVRVARTGKLPSGLDRKGLEQVRMINDSAATTWSAVQAQFKSGKLADALAQAHVLKARVSQALVALGLVADERAWSNVTLPPSDNR